jgi:hypothetical protein
MRAREEGVYIYHAGAWNKKKRDERACCSNSIAEAAAEEQNACNLNGELRVEIFSSREYKRETRWVRLHKYKLSSRYSLCYLECQ